jgi:Ca2+-binding RTX toxin-like protein
MLSFNYRKTLGPVDISFEAPVQELICAPVGDTTLLVAATAADGGLAGFEVQAGRNARALASLSYGEGPGGLSGLDLAYIVQDGETHVIPFGGAAPDWRGYRLDPVTGLEASVGLMPGGGAPGPGVAAEAVATGAVHHLYTASRDTGDIVTYRLGSDMVLSETGRIKAAEQPGGIVGLAAEDGVLLAADARGNALASYRIGPDGALELADRVDGTDGPGLATPSAVQVAEVGGQSYAVLAAAGSGSLTVFRISADGRLSATDHVVDTRDTRFDGATALVTARFGDWQFVLAGGADDGLSLFALLPGGRLLHMGSIADRLDAALGNISALATTVTGAELQVFTASQTEAGIGQLQVDLSDLGRVLQGAADGGLLAGTGADDVLIAGAGSARLQGSAGADMFVFHPDRAAADGLLGKVIDFTPGLDQLDLSALPGLYSIDQITIETGPAGLTLRFDDLWLELAGADLVASDLTTADILNAQHTRLDPVVTTDVILEGSPSSDTLLGGAGNDRIRGAAGDDRLSGLAGDDVIDGGDGRDWLDGGAGNDTIFGGTSTADLDDTIYGGAGNDIIDAGYGDDFVFGQDGNDSIVGGFGADTLQGDNGDDVVTGSAHADLVAGNAGNDFVNGGFGHDRISGGAGADRFYHLGIFDHGSDWIDDYVAAEGDVLLFGQTDATADQFQVNFAHTVDAMGERAGDDAVREAFVIYRPTEQIIWALVDGAGQDAINLRIAEADTAFDLLG